MPDLSAYPDALDALKDDHQDKKNEPVAAADINKMADAVMKTQSTLGTDPHIGTLPAGLFQTVVARLNAIDNPGRNVQTGSTYTLVIGDFSNVVDMTSSSNQQFIIPPNSSVPFPLRAAVTIRAGGTGQVSWAGGSGVVVNCRGGGTHIAGQYGYAVAIQVDTDVWDIIGDVA